MCLLAGQLLGGGEPVSVFSLGSALYKIETAATRQLGGDWPSAADVDTAMSLGPKAFEAYLAGVTKTLGNEVEVAVPA